MDFSAENFTNANELDWDAVSQNIGSTDARLKGYLQSLQRADGTIDTASASTQGFSRYLRETGQAYDFTALKATLLNSALNAGIMLAVVVQIKLMAAAWNHFNVTVAETQEKIQETTARLSNFNEEYKTLTERNPDSLSNTEKERLDYLSERISKEQELLKLQQANAASEEIGGKFTDLFDEDSFTHKMFMEKYAKFSPLEILFGGASDNITVLNTNTRAAVFLYNKEKEDMERYQKELEAGGESNLDYATASSELERLQKKFEHYDLSNMQEQLLRWEEKKLEYTDAIAQLKEDAANPHISSKSHREANEKIEEYQKWVNIADKNIKDLSNILIEPQNLIDSLDERLSRLSVKDLQKNFSEAEITTLANLTFDEDASISDLKILLRNAQEASDNNPVTTTLEFSIFEEAFQNENFQEAREKLMMLARSGELTAKSFQEVSGTDSFLTQLDISADEATDKILSMLTSQEKLAGANSVLDKLAEYYGEFQELGYLTAQSLEALPDVFHSLDGFDVFAEIAGDPSQGADRIQEGFNEITKQYLLSQDTLSGLLDASDSEIQSYIANLEHMNIQNAEEIVNQILTLPENTSLLKDAEEEYLNYLANKEGYDTEYLNSVASKNGQLAAALGAPYQADYDNWINLLVKKTDAYNTFVNSINASQTDLFSAPYSAYGQAEEIIKESAGKEPSDSYTSVMPSFYMNPPKNTSKYTKHQIDSANNLLKAQKEQKQAKEKLRLDLSPINPQFGSRSLGNSGSGGSSAAKAPTPQTYDWVEKKLASIAALTERAGKAFEKAFSFGSTQKKFKEYLSAIDADLAANRTAADTYQTKMNSLGLAPAWVDKIKSGAYAIEDVTNETLKKQISDYETYYGKWKKCDEALLALEEKRAQAQKSRADKTISFQEKELRKTQLQISRKKALADLKESFGLSASGKDYAFQQKKSAAQLSTLKKHNAYLKTLQKTVAKGSDAWNAYQEQTEKNTEKSRELTQAIADLAAKAAGLPTEKLDKFLEKNNQKQELYEAKAASSVGNNKNNWIQKQISLTAAKNRKTAGTAEQTKKNLRTAGFADLRAAQNADQKGRSKSGKARVKTYYADMRKYVKKKKAIPAEFIQKLINAGFHQMARAAANYNAALAANETAQAAAKLSAETTRQEIAGLAQKQFQNTQSSYENEQHKISSRSEYFSSAISLAESQGRLADHNYYQTRLLLEQGNQKSLAEERRTLQSILNRAVARGNIREFSDEWLEMADSIYQVDQALAQSKETLAEYQNQLQQIKFDHFEYLQEQISRLTQEADFYIGVLAAKPLTDDAGLTEQGVATMGLHYQKSEIYQNQAAQYAKEIERLNRELLKDPVNTTWISQLENYQDMQKECIQNAQNEKQAIAELVTQGYQALIDSLDKSVSKYKELLQNAKNAHEYQKNIARQTDQISTLKKQINAYASMTESEETSAKLQQLMNDLEQAQSSLDETMYDKYLSDTQNAMDEMVNDLEDFLSELSEHSDQLIQEGIDMVKGSADAISTTMTDLSKEYGSTLSAAMSASWGNYGSAAGGVDAVINSFRELMAATGQKNDEQAYQDASAIYTNYRSFDQRIANAKSDQNTLKEQRDKAKKEKEQAKKNLDKVKKKNGKNSKQYKAAEQKYHTANKNYEEAEKKFKNSKQKVENLKAQQEAAKTSGKTTVQNFLTAIADAGPSKPSASMDALDNAVLQITGGYINDANRRQILSLLGANDAGQAAAILKELGFAVPAADGGRLVSVGDNSFQKEAAKDTSKNKKTPSQTKKDTSKNKKNTSKNKKKKPSKNNTASGKLKDTAPKTMAKSSSYQRLSSQSDNGYHKNDSAPFQPQNLFSQTRSGFLPDLLTPENMMKDYIPSGSLEPGNLTITTGDLLLPDVTDPSEFASGMVNALKNDPTVQKTLGSLVNSSLTRGNSLITQKY